MKSAYKLNEYADGRKVERERILRIIDDYVDTHWQVLGSNTTCSDLKRLINDTAS